ncbi:PPPDE putative peptidase domain-containing protein [Sphaerosporella brunnea]|uniref:PPPDE putative peptidase domain-containing protein n=1 Tax=Sphaerosporella brunnea TaxID=1250544 RepID=A0A5J5ET98_9PEZI|nr:PPPDE putative peptidase domain-containing protein [Sphaerosporella brunnea]
MSTNRRPTNSSLQKTSVIINVYDLLPPGRLSATLWFLGTGLLHTGVCIGEREFAFGGHDRPDVTGVYWTKPKTDPPGGTWRCEILHGFTYATAEEIEGIVREASKEFLGPSYNLLTRNCNHFTSHLCQALTGQPAPAYLNRAASIGVAMPCVVPAGWVEPPECELEEGEDEEARLTATTRRHSVDDAWDTGSDDGGGGAGYDSDSEDERRRRERQKAEERRKRRGQGDARDKSGKGLPAAERARLDTTVV